MESNKSVRLFIGAMITARKNLQQEARMIELDNLPQCVKCRVICHCDMINSQEERESFLSTGLCPNCQDDLFWGK